MFRPSKKYPSRDTVPLSVFLSRFSALFLQQKLQAQLSGKEKVKSEQ
jgi:hypothetical protein